MAIRIVGSARFRQRVVAALGEICPCFDYTLAADGRNTVRLTALPRQPRDLFCRKHAACQ